MAEQFPGMWPSEQEATAGWQRQIAARDREIAESRKRLEKVNGDYAELWAERNGWQARAEIAESRLAALIQAGEPFQKYLKHVMLWDCASDGILLTDFDHDHKNAVRVSHFRALAALIQAGEQFLSNIPKFRDPVEVRREAYLLPTEMNKCRIALAAALEQAKASQPHASLSAEVETAVIIATLAHFGQTTESEGMNYIEHPAAVAASVPDECRAAAWLHDVLEDSKFTVGQLLAAGIRQETVNAVLIVTRDSGESYQEFIGRIAASGNVAAITVKLADLRHNMRPSCPERLAHRYRAAVPVLEAALEQARGGKALRDLRGRTE